MIYNLYYSKVSKGVYIVDPRRPAPNDDAIYLTDIDHHGPEDSVGNVDNHALYHHIRDALYKIGITDMASFTFQKYDGEVTTLGPYLPSGGYFVGSASVRLVQGFTDNAVRLVRVSDLAEQDFKFKTNTDFLDLDDIKTWANGSEVAVKTEYDQTGSARVLTQTVLDNMPRLNLNDGSGYSVASSDLTAAVNNNTPRGLVMTGISVERTTCTIFQTERSYFSPNRCFFELATSNVRDLGMIGASTGAITMGSALPNSAFVRAQKETHSVTSSLTEIIARIGSQSYTAAPLTAKVSNKFNQFTSVSDTSKYQASDIYATVIYNTTRADAAAIHALLDSRFGVVANREKRVIFDGDSLMCSYGSPRGHSTPYFTDKHLPPRVDIANVGAYGFRFISAVTNVAVRVGAIARADHGDLVVVRYGTNDILADSQTAPQVMTRLEAFLAQLRTVYSGKICVCTIPPGNWGDAVKQQVRLDYNKLLLERAASLNVFIARNNTDPAFTKACINGDTKYTLSVHYTEAGYNRIHELELNDIIAALST